jgi:hypothetical protein
MSILETTYGWFQKQEIAKYNDITDFTKTRVEDIISTDLMNIFWINSEQAQMLNSIEVTPEELQLAKMFGVEDKMSTLNNDLQLLSLRDVMAELDNYKTYSA